MALGCERTSSSPERWRRDSSARSSSSRSVLSCVLGGQISGRGCKGLRQLPCTLLRSLQPSVQAVAPLCMELEAALIENQGEACARVLSTISHTICELNSPHLQLNREAFVLFGGDVLLLRCLFCPFATTEGSGSSGGSAGAAGSEKMVSIKLLSLQKECLNILRELCCTVTYFTESLAAHDDFVINLFGLMGFYSTFDCAVVLAEEVLAVREDTLRVQEIPNFTSLVHKFSSRQLASFCRVLAMVVFEPEAGNWTGQVDVGLNQSSVGTGPPKPKMEEEPGWTVVDRNHDAILLIPDILSRLVKLLMLDKLPFSHESVLSSEVSAFAMTMSVNGSALESLYNAVSEGRGHILEEVRASNTRAEMHVVIDPALQSQQTMAGTSSMDDRVVNWNITFLDRTGPSTGVIHLATHHVEVLFVLCALCGGKKREQVQNRLGELGLVGVLTQLFDKLDWKATQSRSSSRGIHGVGCACNPKSALKIQYLRLIHNFCDRDSCNRVNKQLLLLPAPFKESSWFPNPTAEVKDSDGLMLKILKVLIKEPADSLYRFWLASCVEAFLGGADSKNQEFVASTGLMEHLLAEILKGGFQCATSLQINFDLLGELIKFNQTLFQQLNRLLVGDKFDRFVEVLVTNLVDSNVFVRSVVLSLDYFRRHQWAESASNGPGLVAISAPERRANMSNADYRVNDSSVAANYDAKFCKVTAFVFHNTLRLLRDLMCAVRLSDVNQDNICVLNTVLIFFIFAERDGELQLYLQALRAADHRVLCTFRSLLDFWRSYYLRKRGRECISLQYSTQLDFSDWLHVVDLLCSQPDSPTSLLYSLPSMGAQCMALAASGEPLPQQC
ncbi:unnamed protein product [Sphagnum jensenii]|uniref:Short transient receptor potential channel 4-associated protein n=1 Tax=Sphagnum jensenii TaxID=128206 RepID=A0ABP0VTA3_9BRYO